MKLAYLINRYPQASHSFIRREIAALEEAGVEVQRISIRAPNAVVDPADHAEMAKTFVIFDHLLKIFLLASSWELRHPLKTFRCWWLAARLGFKAGEPLKYFYYLNEALALAAFLEARRIPHVHAHFGTNPATVAMFCFLLGGASYSLTIHGPEEFDSPQKLALGRKVKHAKFVAAISEFGRSQIYRWCGAEDWKKIHVIHCGVDEHFLTGKSQAVPDAPRLVCVGRLCEQKGQLLLVRAAAEVVRSGLALELVLVGDGPMRRDVEKLIAEYQLADHVKITGWQTAAQVRDHILASRALVLPSFAEGLPVVIMEALALHRPVISTYVAGIPELVEHGKSGWLVPAGDAGALVGAIRPALSASPKKLAEMGAVGAEKARRNHDARIEARKMLPLFADMVPGT